MIQLKKSYVSRLETISSKLLSLSSDIESNGDIILHYGNGSVIEQLDIARAAIDSIYQELV